MTNFKFSIFLLFVFGAKAAHCQKTDSLVKHRNSFGLSFDMGGRMERAPDIDNYSVNESQGFYANPVGKDNFGFSLFWEHQWNFYKNHGLLFGLGASITAFDYDIAFKNPDKDQIGNPLPPTKEHILGNGFRSSFFSLDLPLYYTFSIKTKFGDFNPFIGVNVRNLAYVLNAGRNYGGVSGREMEVTDGDTTYFNQYNIKFGTQSLIPALMPTFGVRYSRLLKNGGFLNIHITRKMMLRNSNSPEVYLNNYDNIENDIYYWYYQEVQAEDYLFNSNGEIVGPKMSQFYRINMSSINFGVSYSFK